MFHRPSEHYRLMLARSRQNGTGKLVLLLLLVVLVFMIHVALRLVPVYVDHFYARTIASDLTAEASGSLERQAFLDDFQRRARINNVSFDNEFFRFEGNPVERVVMNYERRVPLLFNIDAVVQFEELFTE